MLHPLIVMILSLLIGEKVLYVLNFISVTSLFDLYLFQYLAIYPYILFGYTFVFLVTIYFFKPKHGLRNLIILFSCGLFYWFLMNVIS